MLAKGGPLNRVAAGAVHPRTAPISLPLRCPLKGAARLQQRQTCYSAGNEQQQTQDGQQQAPQQPQQQGSHNTPSVSSSIPSTSSEANGMYSVMTALAAAGAFETSYLTVTKLLNATAACPTNGCDTVLNSAFGTLFGLPLPLYGAATYSAVAVAAGVAAATVAAQKPVPGWLNTGGCDLTEWKLTFVDACLSGRICNGGSTSGQTRCCLQVSFQCVVSRMQVA